MEYLGPIILSLVAEAIRHNCKELLMVLFSAIWRSNFAMRFNSTSRQSERHVGDKESTPLDYLDLVILDFSSLSHFMQLG